METLFYPIIVLLKTILMAYHRAVGGFAIPLLLLSATTSICIIPFERWGTRIAQREKALQKILAPQLARIKKESTGKARHDRASALYSRYAYHPIYALQSACGLLVQLPLLFSAYYMIANLAVIKGVPISPFIADLSQPDHILWGINVLPLAMTAMNITALLTTPGFSRKDTVQGLVIAGLFLVLLYNSPSALLLYWTANNLFSLIKNLLSKGMTTPVFFVRHKTMLIVGGAVVLAGICTFGMYSNPAFVPAEAPTWEGKFVDDWAQQITPKKISCDTTYSFDNTRAYFPYADPVTSNMTLSSGMGMSPLNKAWGTFDVRIAPTPLERPLTLELAVAYAETNSANLVITLQDVTSGNSHVYTNRPVIMLLDGIELNEDNLLRIRTRIEGTTQQVAFSSMRLNTSYSEAKLKEIFDSAQPIEQNNLQLKAVNYTSDDIERTSVSNATLIIKSIGIDPYLVFNSVDVPKGEIPVLHVKISAPEATTLQVFYQTMGSRFMDEKKSVLRKLLVGENDLYLELPKDFTGDFRIDPGMLEEEQVYEINDIEFRAYKQGHP